jgi:CheY-like chemotaxis protein
MGNIPGRLSGVYILVVDDNWDAREINKAFLEYFGAVVQMVDSAWAALDSVRRAVPDVIVSDLTMPGDDGRWLLQELRKMPRAFAVPVVAVTAHGYRYGRDAMLREGFADYLTKPISPQKLCESIARLTGR